MSGVFFQFSNEGSTFVATDAHKLVRYVRTDLIVGSNESVSGVYKYLGGNYGFS